MSQSQELVADKSIFTKDGFKEKFNWKIALIMVIPVFIIYPKPFLYILSPIIKRIQKQQKKSTPKLQKIILSTSKQLNSQKAHRLKLYQSDPDNIYILNLFQADLNKSKGSEVLKRSVSWQEALNVEPTLFLRAQNAVLRLKMLCFQLANERQQNYAVIIKGYPQLLRVVEAKLYGMDCTEYFKIPMFQQKDVHILELCTDGKSYEQHIKEIRQI